MHRHLAPELIHATIERYEGRIAACFPESSLRRVAAELCSVSRETMQRIELIQRPPVPLRGLAIERGCSGLRGPWRAPTCLILRQLGVGHDPAGHEGEGGSAGLDQKSADCAGSRAGATAFDVSADGQTVVGMADELPPINLVKAFRWSPVDGMRDVGIPPGCCFISVARATGVSSDGTVIVGVDGNNESFRVRHSVVGETYCRPAVPSSSGCAGALIVRGLPLATVGTLRLEAALLPQNSFGFFLASRAPGFTSNVPNSQGNLCLAGAIGRFVGPGQIQNSGANGAFALDIDVSALPTPTGPVAGQVGETWHFQAWFRDGNPNPTSDLTDAVRVLLR